MMGPGTSDDRDVRAALAQITDGMPHHPARNEERLVVAVHQRTARIIRRRRAVRGGLVAASVAAVIAGATGLIGLPGATVQHGPNQPEARTSDAGPATTQPRTTASTSPSTTLPPPVSTSIPVPSEPHTPGRPRWEDTFAGPLSHRWTVYTSGQNTGLSDWSASDVSVSDGALHLSVTRTRAGTPVATSGGMGARGTTASTGRWVARWRLTEGQGVIGQLVLSDGDRPRYLATLSHQGLTFDDTVTGRHASKPVRAGVFHTVAIDVRAGSVRWIVDGDVVTSWAASGAGQHPLWPALQVLLAGPDCGAAPLPADCDGAATTFPQRLDVEQIEFHTG